MDLSGLSTKEGATQGAWLHLEHPVSGLPLGEPGKPCRWRIAGADSEQYQKAARRQQARRMEDAAQSRSRRANVLSADRLREESLDLVAGCVLDWENVELNGATVPFSIAAARAMLVDHDWLREQVEEFLNDRANFLPPSKMP
jgi:hypothetical protein